MPIREDPTLGPAAVLEASNSLEREGRVGDAIRLLTEENHRTADARLEAHLVALRHSAFDAVDRTPPTRLPAPITAESPDPVLREHVPDELDPRALREGIARSGCLLVRGLISNERAQQLAAGIDKALEGFDRYADAASDTNPSPWYLPFEPRAGTYRVGGRRNWVRASGAVWTVDSPRMLFQLCDLLDDTGIGDLVTSYLGERPALSANKCTLRRVPIDTSTNWHQDGAFLGAKVRTMNLWLVLSDCGDDSPGLEILPRRLDTVLQTGTDGAMFDWSVSPTIVSEIAGDTPVIAPHFRAGDALLFDHFLLHRTAVGPGMRRERYAMETWMFAPSSYPDGQIPVVY